ncbi:flavanone 3-dioxygenase 2 [Selaginella moellendorffii]|nr:flavanone 3-dioxygenase 2 [Selaginella moellendorffii]|eukprot:XP_024524225.1 flavanone 3-dioxygenase 2 [Selaginella moellendorffii]
MAAVASRIAGVKGLADAGIAMVPGEYRRDSDPRQCVEIEEIPVIDLSDVEKCSPARILAIDSIRSASRDWGFFQIVGHGFPEELMASMMELVHDFFRLPIEDRSVYYSEDSSSKFRMGTSFIPSKETRRMWQDFLHQACYPPCEIAQLPTKPPSYVKISTAYAEAMNRLSKRVLGLFSESLGLESGALEEAFGGERHTMRMNYYPPCPEPELTIGLDAHADPNGFTILQQDTRVKDGLQILHCGAWVPIKPLPGAFVVNIGDQLQILSNDVYKSVEHRVVVNSERTRVSIASFYGPAEDSHIAPMAQLVTDDAPACFKESAYGKYLQSFYASKLDGKAAIKTVRY